MKFTASFMEKIEQRGKIVKKISGQLKELHKRKLASELLDFASSLSIALMIWKGLAVATGSESPIVAVLSGSMRPAFDRGDVLFLTNDEADPIRVGEIVVFKIRGREVPIVHRVIRVHEKSNGIAKFLTKGDNNTIDDISLYASGQFWLDRSDVVGRVRGLVPHIGVVSVLLNEYPVLKYTLLVVLIVVGLMQRSDRNDHSDSHSGSNYRLNLSRASAQSGLTEFMARRRKACAE